MKKILTILSCALLFSFSSQAAQEVQSEHVSARLLSAYDGVSSVPLIDMGLAIALEPEWYTYWRMPGDNGVAPSFNWKDSVNVKDVKVLYPAPQRFTTFDMHSFGYRNEFILPLDITPAEKGKPVTLNLEINIVICHDICIPATLNLSKTLNGDPNKRTPDHAVLKRVRATLPVRENTKKLGMDTAVLGKDAIVVTVFAKDGFDQTDLFVEAPDTLITAPPIIMPDAQDKTRAVLKIPAPNGFDFARALFGKTVTITLINKGEAVEKDFSF